MCSNRLWRLWDCRQAAEEGPPPRRCRKVSLLGAAAAFAGLLGLAAVSPAAEAPPMRVGSEIAYPPFCSLDAQGRADGFSVELIRESLRAMNREATFRVGEWNEVRGWLERGEVEALPLVGRTPEREAIYDFTFPYMTLFGAIVVRNDTSGIAGLDDLRGRSVAVMKGDNAEEFLRREDRGIDIQDDARVVIGDDNNFGPNFTLVTPLHPMRADERRLMQDAEGAPRRFCFAKPVAIGNDCWFGANVVVCPGVTIGDRCVIGAGSVVTRDVPPDSFAAGNPCRVIRAITEADSMVHKPAVLAGNRVIG